MCEKMDAATALAWGLVDEVVDDGATVEAALAGALHHATSFADGDQSQLTGSFEAARTARERFGKR